MTEFMVRRLLIVLQRDARLWRWSTWRSDWRLLARDGRWRASFGPWRDFRPSRRDAAPATARRREPAASCTVVA
jgi:hypothetical protein